MKTILRYLKPGDNCSVEVQPGVLEEVPGQNNSFIFKTSWPSKGYSKTEDYIQLKCSNKGESIFKMLLTYEQARELRTMLNNCMENFHGD
jgi:hypothetical protein